MKRAGPERISVEEFRRLFAPKPKRKFRNTPSEHGGRRYPSKAQAKWMAEQELRVRAGEIRAVIPEVSIPLPAPFTRERMRLDAMIVHNDGTFEFADVKGMDPTPTWNLRRAAVENGYGIRIEVIKRTKTR